jgi:hypothetical protein
LKHIDKVPLGRQLVAGFEAAIQDCRLDLIDKVLKDAIVLCFSKHGLRAPQMPLEHILCRRETKSRQGARRPSVNGIFRPLAAFSRVFNPRNSWAIPPVDTHRSE